MLRTTFTTLALAALLTATAAQAGRSCEQRLPDADAVQRSVELAERTRQALDATGAEVVVLARAGQDLGRWGLQWSHLGLAYRDPFAGGAWRVVHKLNQCGGARADLYRHGLAEFFLDDLWQYRAALAPLAVLLPGTTVVVREQVGVWGRVTRDGWINCLPAYVELV